jgi:cyclopropane fatty-acyl-phospholipid synthase-like methyltransferase
MGREISAVMGWQGAAWLEREERDREERTDLLLAALALQSGLVVADIGAGTGYLSRRMAPAVMPGGKVWGVDIERGADQARGRRLRAGLGAHREHAALAARGDLPQTGLSPELAGHRTTFQLHE